MPSVIRPHPVGAHHRLLSCITTTSQHSGNDDDDEDSLCLSQLVHNFLQDDETEGPSLANDLGLERVDSVSECPELMESTLAWSVVKSVDPYKKQLLLHVSEAVEMFSFLRRNVSALRRNVVAFLREKGHNAAICKTKWDSSGDTIPGNHEFIDEARSGSSTWQTRYFVEIDFADQFEIARPTRQYEEVLSSLPSIFVGRADELKRTVRMVCDVAKRCFECTGLSVPPWRKTRFMRNKWFAPYCRTTNPVQGNEVPAVVKTINGANCRLVGFYDIVSGARPGGASVRTR